MLSAGFKNQREIMFNIISNIFILGRTACRVELPAGFTSRMFNVANPLEYYPLDGFQLASWDSETGFYREWNWCVYGLLLVTGKRKKIGYCIFYVYH